MFGGGWGWDLEGHAERGGGLRDVRTGRRDGSIEWTWRSRERSFTDLGVFFLHGTEVESIGYGLLMLRVRLGSAFRLPLM